MTLCVDRVRAIRFERSKKMKKAIVLTTGGLHSTTALAIAASRDYELYALSFDYGQRNRVKLEAAKAAAQQFHVKEHKIVSFDIRPLLGTDSMENVAIPARNNLFLAFALSWAETVGVLDFFIGVSEVEYGARPDCRKEFVHTFEAIANVGMKKEKALAKANVWSPLMLASVADVIRRGTELGVDYGNTYSCQHLDEKGLACGQCDSCVIRRDGFTAADRSDPTRYQA